MQKVTENDFRKEEYKGANPDDYEFRSDGALVRKDRFINGMRRLCTLVRINPGDYEIPLVLQRAEYRLHALDCFMNRMGEEDWDRSHDEEVQLFSRTVDKLEKIKSELLERQEQVIKLLAEVDHLKMTRATPAKRPKIQIPAKALKGEKGGQ